MSRRAVVDALERLAFAAELLSDPRARAWASASWAVRNLSGDVAAMSASGELAEVRGVGEATLEVVDEVLAGDKPRALAEREARLPEGLFAIRQVKGLGPKKIKRLWKELGIRSLGELEYACRENRLLELAGFGAKTQDKILAQIAALQARAGLLRRDQAARLLAPVLQALQERFGRAAIVGDYPRGVELVREPAVLVAAAPDRADEAGEVGRAAAVPERPVSVFVAAPPDFAACAVWRTSSPGHRHALADRARERGLTLDASGLREVDGAPRACADEDAVYEALGLALTAPERRDDGVPLVERGRATPRLLRREDLRGALHNHSVASDGSATLEEMREAAARRGLDYLGISEHSHTAFYARGLDAERLRAQLARIAALNAEDGACALLSGVESDILERGELDYPDALLAQLEVVVASVHKRFKHTPEQRTARFVAAAHNPYTDVIGHPTGRLLLARDPSPFDVEALLDACAQSGCAVELNANPHRLDLRVEHLAMAKARGVLVSIAADAHAAEELDHLTHGVALARRAGLTAEDVLNARTLEELRAWVAARRARAPDGPRPA